MTSAAASLGGGRAKRAAVGPSPRAVTRGEPEGFSTLVDYLTFTVALPVREVLDALSGVIDGFVVKPRDGGIFGFAESAELVGLGLVGWGGSAVAGRVMVSLSASGCAAVHDWPYLARILEGWGARITRVDLAFDDFFGSRISVDRARRWYKRGGFDMRARRPAASFVDDMGSGAGRTFYVGRRTSGKLLRVYEKGRAFGDPRSEWVRAEVEWRNNDRAIPYDALTRPADYIAGAYPVLSFVSSVIATIKTCKQVATRSLRQVVESARVHAGRVVGFLVSLGADAREIVDVLARPGTPRRLKGWDRHLRGESEWRTCKALS